MFPSESTRTEPRAAGCAAAGSDVDDDSSYDTVISVPRSREAELLLEQIEDRIEKIERQVEPLLTEHQRLMIARASILGEPAERPSRRAVRVTREDVVAAIEAAPGSRVGGLARTLGTTQQVVSAHLYRGKATLFKSRGGRWYLRTGPDA